MTAAFAYTGLSIITHRLRGLGTEPKYIGWGTGSAEPAGSDTGLSSEAVEPRVNGTSTIQTTARTDDTYQVVGKVVAIVPKTITNAGLFDALTNGNLFMRVKFTGIPLQMGDGIMFTIQVQFE